MNRDDQSLPALDGFRGLACLIVMIAHFPQNRHIFFLTGGGKFGLMLFFVLSGFLMSYHYMLYVTYFLSGMLAAMAYKSSLPLMKYPPLFYSVAALAGAWLFLYLPLMPQDRNVNEIWQFSDLYSLVAGLIIFSLVQAGPLLQWFFSNRLMCYMGEISFSLYLLHMSIYRLNAEDFYPSGTFMLALSDGLFLLLLGHLIYYFVEQSFTRYGKILSGQLETA